MKKKNAKKPFPYAFGNWVMSPSGEKIKIESIVVCPAFDIFVPHVNLYPVHEIQGIPLTEEIVESCGFEFYNYEDIPPKDEDEKSDELQVIKCYRKFFNKNVLFGLESTPSGNWCFYTAHETNSDFGEASEDMKVICFLKYVHELQNIYQLTFDEELEIVF